MRSFSKSAIIVACALQGFEKPGSDIRPPGGVVVAVVAFTLNRFFYPTTSSAVHPASVILLPRDTNYVVKD